MNSQLRINLGFFDLVNDLQHVHLWGWATRCIRKSVACNIYFSIYFYGVFLYLRQSRGNGGLQQGGAVTISAKAIKAIPGWPWKDKGEAIKALAIWMSSSPAVQLWDPALRKLNNVPKETTALFWKTNWWQAGFGNRFRDNLHNLF